MDVSGKVNALPLFHTHLYHAGWLQDQSGQCREENCLVYARNWTLNSWSSMP